MANFNFGLNKIRAFFNSKGFDFEATGTGVVAHLFCRMPESRAVDLYLNGFAKALHFQWHYDDTGYVVYPYYY